MKYILSLLIFASSLLTININFAAAHSSSEEKIIFDGLTDIYNLRFNDAEIKFKNLQRQDPNGLEGYFYESLLYFYKSLPSRDEVMFEKYLQLSDILIVRAENILDKNENDFDALYYKGLSHSYRSLLMLSLNKSLLKAASNGNDGYRILSMLIEKKPDYYDAYMGLGLYKIAIGFVPEKFQWLLTLIGFNGNIQEGVRLLETSLANGKYTKVESKAFLSIFSIKEREDDDRRALNFSRELTEEFPSSSVFRLFYSSLLLQNGLTEDAIKVSNEALGINKNSFQDEVKKTANAILGTAYFRQNDFPKASEYLDEYMKYVIREDRYNVYLFTLGVSQELSGNRTLAVSKYKSVRDNFINERDGELDKFFYRYAQDKIKKPLRTLDAQFIEAMNMRESNLLDEALKTYNSIASDLKEATDDDMIRLYFNLGVTYAYKKDDVKAAECFNKCLKFDPKSEIWLLPHSYFELGKIYDRQGNKNLSDQMFDKIFDFDDFDFESFLEMRLANYRNK
ncbi:MAG: tetratricopeptide repeat protein [Ignavibacteria bacterium]